MRPAPLPRLRATVRPRNRSMAPGRTRLDVAGGHEPTGRCLVAIVLPGLRYQG
jgi:hypothetical protein